MLGRLTDKMIMLIFNAWLTSAFPLWLHLVFRFYIRDRAESLGIGLELGLRVSDRIRFVYGLELGV